MSSVRDLPVHFQSSEAIAEAVRMCVTRCTAGNTPLGVIAEFAGELRDRGWQESDVQVMERTVRKVLAGLITNDDKSEGTQN